MRFALLLMLGVPLVAIACASESDGDDDDTDAGAADTDTDSDSDADSDGDADTDGDTDPVTCETIHEGYNVGFPVDELARNFMLGLPAGVEEGGPWPVVFNFHGLGDTAQNMHNLLAGQVNDAALPFILVTPEDTDVTVLSVVLIDWLVHQVDAETNQEARLFDELLACLDERFGVDEDHVHAVGFSMGGFCADMLGVIRGAEIASLVTYSGGYGSNPANDPLMGMLGTVVDWPDPTHGNRYGQMLLYGGETDVYDLSLLTLEIGAASPNDAVYLNGMGHDVVLCNHDSGHTVPAGMMGDEVVEFFADHPRGVVDSPYATDGLPADFADYCSFMAGD